MKLALLADFQFEWTREFTHRIFLSHSLSTNCQWMQFFYRYQTQFFYSTFAVFFEVQNRLAYMHFECVCVRLWGNIFHLNYSALFIFRFCVHSFCYFLPYNQRFCDEIFSLFSISFSVLTWEVSFDADEAAAVASFFFSNIFCWVWTYKSNKFFSFWHHWFIFILYFFLFSFQRGCYCMQQARHFHFRWCSRVGKCQVIHSNVSGLMKFYKLNFFYYYFKNIFNLFKFYSTNFIKIQI